MSDKPANASTATTGSSKTGSSNSAPATDTPASAPIVASPTTANAPPPANAGPPEPTGPPPLKKTIKFTGRGFKKDHQMFLSFTEGPTEPFIYYELAIPHVNFFFSKANEENVFDFEYVDQLAVGAGVKMSGYPSGGPITWSYIKRGQKASLTMQGHKMKIGVEDDSENPTAIEFTNRTNSSYPQTLSLGFVNNQTFTTISSNPQTTTLSFSNFMPHLYAYYTRLTDDLTHVDAIKLWDAKLYDQQDFTCIELVEDAKGMLSVVKA